MPQGPKFELAGGTILRPVDDADAEVLADMVATDRPRLARWLPWAEGNTVETTREFITQSKRQLEADEGLQLAIVHDGSAVGSIGFHNVDLLNRSTSLGYWIAKDYEGRGIVTAAVAALVDHAFGVWMLHRVEIRAAVDNARSRAVCERLGFVQEGVLRGAERVGERYNDLVVYSIVEADWRGSA